MSSLRVVGTGSSGNCYVLKNDNDILILDAGIPLPQIYEAIHFKIADVNSCFVSHFHGDHSSSVKNLLKLYVPVIMSEITANLLDLSIVKYPSLITTENTTIGGWTIKTFSVEHDAPGTVGCLMVHRNSPNVICYITDAGFVRTSPQGVQTLIIECNYIDDLIDWTALTEQQIRLKQSHMSLARLMSYMQKIDQSKLENIILVHLSDSHSNEKRIVEELATVTKAKIYAATAGLEIEL